MKYLLSIPKLLWDKILVLCSVLGVLLPTSPLNMPLTYRDSGVFLYMGWRILNNMVPYKDVWDHKPPVIFYINALGLSLFDNSRWGVWLLEFFALFLAAYIGFQLIRKILGTHSAVFSLSIWMLTLVFVIHGGNLTTEYTLPLQFFALWLVNDMDKPGFSAWRWFLIGMLGALAFFTKQTAIGIWVAIILYLTIKRLKSRKLKQGANELLIIFAGGFTILSGWVIFFSLHQSLPEFWNAAFIFNAFYSLSITGLMSRLNPIITGITYLSQAGLFQFSMMGYLLGVILILFKKNLMRGWRTLLLVCLIDLPIELVLIGASGRSYRHYYMALLPVLSIFAGLMFWVILSALSSWGVGNIPKSIFVTCVVSVILWSSFAIYRNQIIEFRSAGDEAVIRYVNDFTDPDDYVLLWGAESSVNYFTLRKSPSRYVYQYPLYYEGFVNEQMILEFLGDVISSSPQFIIDTKNSNTPIYEFPIHSEEINVLVEYLRNHYQVVEKNNSWTVYKYVAGDTPAIEVQDN